MSYSDTKPSPTMRYFEQEDILHLAIAKDLEIDGVEISLNITAELIEKTSLISL